MEKVMSHESKMLIETTYKYCTCQAAVGGPIGLLVDGDMVTVFGP